ncbi:MAG: PH domain-containing protein [Alphaproteobacteria bacterium]|nr:PH domain-containing protein [Alphaproteobacteria bacterium]MDE2110975.1 PH domain-containing protein [Alphaproteobacteria bacterium]MDE2493864.1 PH domain-containing protein [Alphaproteobacteria bacterium]
MASLIMFLVFVRLANLFRGGARIRGILEDGETKVHETCVHWVRLLGNIRKDRTAYRWIGMPVLIGLFATLYLALWGGWLIGVKLGFDAAWFHAFGSVFRLARHNGAVLGFYIPLIFAIPFAIAHVAEWSTHRYVITPLRIIIHSGIFDYHMHGILLSRVVDAQQDYTFVQQILGYGDVVFRETSGEAETLECVWGPKKFAKLAVRYSHALEGVGERAKEDIEAG